MYTYPEDLITDYEPALPITLLQRRHEYDDVYSFSFTKPESFYFYAGQNVRLRIPTLRDDENARSMSIASSPSDDTLLFSMHTGSRSLYKQAMLALKPGDVVLLVKRKGTTVWPLALPEKAVCIAGGLGITPIRSLMLDAVERKLSTTIKLVHVCSGTYLYEDDLHTLPHEQARIRRLDIDKTIQALATKSSQALYYVIGSPSFTESMVELLGVQGVQNDSILASRFSGYDSLLA